ncbi:MAG: response regulator [Spirochaetales bacterium]|nr:response regulator [Spirochaetales bacterium]
MGKTLKLHTETILLVDENEALLSSLSKDLEFRGFTIRAARNGSEALRIMEAEPFDVLVTEIMIRGIDGFKVIQYGRELNPQGIFIILSEYRNVELAMNAIRAHVDAYLLKPCTGEELTKEIADSLQRQVRSQIQYAGAGRDYRNETRMAFLKEISASLPTITAEGSDETVLALLEQVGQICGADRVYLIPFRTEIYRDPEIYEWCSPRIAPYGTKLSPLLWALEEIRKGQSLFIQDVSSKDLGADEDLLKRLGAFSLYVCPIMSGNEVVGTFGIHRETGVKPLSEEHLDFYRTLGNLFGLILVWKKYETRINHERDRLLQALEGAVSSSWEWNIQSGKVIFDTHWNHHFGFFSMPIADTAEKWFALIHPEESEAFQHSLEKCLMGESDFFQTEYRLRSNEGEWKCILIQGRIMERDPEMNPLIMRGVQTDITSRKAAEKDLRRALEEKDLLIREIHHRVKNNLAMIVSLINLQKHYAENEQGEEILETLKNRIASIGSVHEMLYQSQDFRAIQASEYLLEITESIRQSFGAGHTISLNVEPLLIDPDSAVPLSIILTELVTNALKHAFDSPVGGEIRISFHREADLYILTISDNGKGIPGEEDLLSSGGLGMRLVTALTKQLGGDFSVDSEGGTGIRISFPISPFIKNFTG